MRVEELENESMSVQQMGTRNNRDGGWGGLFFGYRLRKSLSTFMIERELSIVTLLKGKSDQDCHSQNSSMIYYCFENKTRILR